MCPRLPLGVTNAQQAWIAILQLQKKRKCVLSNTSIILIRGARQHNLKNIDVDVPRGQLTVITGRSGSGKSSLAFDTIHAEGQRRYVESLSAYARQFLEQLPKPDVDRIEGLSPTIAIEQRAGGSGPRSTVATCTEIYDYLRVLFARAGQAECWKCDRPIACQSVSDIVDSVLALPPRTKVMLLAPLVLEQRGSHRALLESVLKRGFIRARMDATVGLLEEATPLSPHKPHTIEAVVDRLVIKPEISERLADSIAIALDLSRGSVIVTAQEDNRWIDTRYSAVPACPDHPEVRIEAISPSLFGFNSPVGACSCCHGLGTRMEFDPELVLPDTQRSLAEGAIAPWRAAGRPGAPGRVAGRFADIISAFCRDFEILPDMAVRHFSAEMRRILMKGTTPKEARRFGASFDGVISLLVDYWETSASDSLKTRWQGFQSESPCPGCVGARLNQQARCVKLGGKSISDVTAMTVNQARAFLGSLTIPEHLRPVADPLIDAVARRLGFMVDVGIEYLTLSRSTKTLSGGEWQRARLATQIGSGLAGVCYVLDEPTIGLHPRDSARLAEILEQLAGLDNTVIVVEHDDQVIARAAHLIDVGPSAGTHGGEIVCAGPLKEIVTCPSSATAGYLTGRLAIPIPQRRRTPDEGRYVELLGASANNLKSIDVRFPLGCFTCVTGVSGSGKSTLVNQVLWRELYRRLHGTGPRPGAFGQITNHDLIEKIIQVDQSAIGRSPRSTPATYTGILDLLRKLFSQTREAKVRGYTPTRFSFNVKGGRCEECEGQGVRRVSMHFLPDMFVRCDRCLGKRYNRETLEVRYRGKTIADVLDMPIDDAVSFFENIANIQHRLATLKDVGLGYMTLGQSSATLSGGEAQRVKLAAELQKTTEGHTLYVLDEPTTGLHFADVRNLLGVLNRLVDRGHSVLVIEHNLEVIKVADWIIDLGPEGGDAGGEVVMAGTPEQLALCPASHTGRFLKDRLNGRPPLATAMADLGPGLDPGIG